jgi:hypothetical protein
MSQSAIAVLTLTDADRTVAELHVHGVVSFVADWLQPAVGRDADYRS